MAVAIPRRSERALPSNQRIVVRERERAPEDSVARELGHTGSALSEFGERMRDAEIASDITEAEIRTRHDMDKALRELQADGTLSHEDITRRYSELSKDILARNTEKIRSPAHKRVWGERAQMILADGESSASRIAMERRVGTAKAKAITLAGEYETMAADPGTLPEVLNESEVRLRELIQRYQRTGVYSPDEAALQMVKLDGVAMAAKSVRHEAQVEKLLDDGQYALAEEYFKVNYGEISPNKRQAIEDTIDSLSREGEAVRMADRFWQESGGDYGPALAEARKIDDPRQRKAVEAQLATLKAQDYAAKTEAYEAAADEGWSLIEEGRPTSKFPADLWARIEPKTQLAMRDYQQAKWKAAETDRETDLQAYADLGEIRATQGPRAARDYLYANAMKFSESDFKSRLNAINSDLSSGSEGESIRSISNAIDFAIGKNGVKGDEAKGEIWKALDQWDRQIRASGKEPTEQELNEEAERLAVRVKLRKPGTAFLWIGNDTTKALGQFGEIGTVPAERSQAVLRGLDIEAGDKPAEVEISTVEAAYSQAMAYLRLQGVSSPSDALLTRVIREKPWEGDYDQ
ncbi:hypothetical protein [Henriciella pelagia]|uniref:hypothetical protein n=1 Tax=Henriciella pelagia TaxID=1977912 RepID=UPI0035195656